MISHFFQLAVFDYRRVYIIYSIYIYTVYIYIYTVYIIYIYTQYIYIYIIHSIYIYYIHSNVCILCYIYTVDIYIYIYIYIYTVHIYILYTQYIYIYTYYIYIVMYVSCHHVYDRDLDLRQLRSTGDLTRSSPVRRGRPAWNDRPECQKTWESHGENHRKSMGNP